MKTPTRQQRFAHLAQAAIDAGECRFMPDEPCKNGHMSERYVASYDCLECSLEAGMRYRARVRRNKYKHRESRSYQAARTAHGLPDDFVFAAAYDKGVSYIGNECDRGHRERYVTGNRCVQCAKESR
jgi:hypothetical protein